MAKTNKVTLKAIREALGEKPENTTTFTIGAKENTVEVTVKKTLSFEERRDMVNGIVDMLFVNDGENGEQYCPYLKKFAFEYHIVTFFTNISLPAKVEDIWDFFYTTDVANRVVYSLPDGYVAEIIAEANEMIEFKKVKLAKQNKLDEVLSSAVGLFKAISKKLEGADGKAILEYLEQNIPELKGELGKVIQEKVAEEAVK